jgi:hypothetical protein
VTNDVADLRSVGGACSAGGNFNDCISSVEIAAGWTMTVYENTNFTGASAVFTQDMANLGAISGPCAGTWNNCISSFRLTHK